MAQSLFGAERKALESAVSSLGEPSYRASQLYVWLYKKRAKTFGAMTNLSKSFRGKLQESFDLSRPTVDRRQRSEDATVKYLFRLSDGATIETVFIPETRRRTICISTQAGCPLKCAFCLTGVSGYKRNLTTGEIVGQVATVMDEAEASQVPWNVVVMGMGEPLLNYDQTVAALRILMDPEGFAVPAKKLTLSTVGILPALRRLMEDKVLPNLAISLHAPTTELRRVLMPIEERYPLGEVIAAAQAYPVPRGGRVTYEYVLLKGVNDSPTHARQLASLLSGARSKVNLIPLNPAPEIPFEAPSAEAVEAFRSVLDRKGVAVTVRRPRGQDILAACGQLHLQRPASLVSQLA